MRIEVMQADGFKAGGSPGSVVMQSSPSLRATCALLCAAVIALLLCAAPSRAADPAPAKGATAAKGSTPAKAGTLGKAPGQSAAAPSTAPAGEPMLTRDELRQCLRQEEELKAGNGRLMEVQAGVNAEGKSLTEAEASLKAEREGVDATSAEAVSAFNAKLAALRERADAYRSRAQAFNEEVAAHQTRHQAWVGDCGGRSYDEIDYFAIQRGK